MRPVADLRDSEVPGPNVDSRSSQTPGSQGARNGRCIDDTSSSCVDQVRAFRQHLERLGVHQVFGFGSKRAVNTEYERLREELVERLDTANPDRFIISILLVGIIEDHVHPQGFGP